jgi:hypothetical protein
MIVQLIAIVPGLTMLAVTSCESTDHRLTEFVQRSSDQQSRQNERLAEQSTAIAKQSQEVAATAHDLVQQDAAARRDMLQAQDQWQRQISSERSDLDLQRRELDGERKEAARAAVRDPVIGQAMITAATMLAALLPLLIAAYAFHRLPENGVSDQLLADAVIAEWTHVSQLGSEIDLAEPAVAIRSDSRLAQRTEAANDEEAVI